jgi:hypothetical protein
MAGQKAEINAARRRAKPRKKAGLKADKALAEARGDLTTAQEKVEQERESRTKTEKAPTEAQNALSAARLEVEREREAGIEAEKGQTGAERAFEEARMTETNLGEDKETPLKTLREEGAERRASFIVRLTVDAHGEPRRTEVEDVQSGKKETFASLDSERLTAFMRACIGTLVVPKPTMPPAPLSIGMGIPKPLSLSASLTISDVQVFRPGAAAAMALLLSSKEPFVVQARFQLQGPDARSLTVKQSSYETKVYANSVTSSESKLLATYSGSLAKDVLEYTAQMHVPGLSPGLYHLVTRVSLGAPNRLAGYYEGPVIRVI